MDRAHGTLKEEAELTSAFSPMGETTDEEAGPLKGEAELTSAFSPVGGTTDEEAGRRKRKAKRLDGLGLGSGAAVRGGRAHVRFLAGGWNHRRGSKAAGRGGRTGV